MYSSISSDGLWVTPGACVVDRACVCVCVCMFRVPVMLVSYHSIPRKEEGNHARYGRTGKHASVTYLTNNTLMRSRGTKSTPHPPLVGLFYERESHASRPSSLWCSVVFFFVLTLCPVFFFPQTLHSPVAGPRSTAALIVGKMGAIELPQVRRKKD